MPNSYDPHGKFAIVTGGDRGTGKAIAGSIALGAALWILASVYAGRREAWDAAAYWAVAYPAAILASGLLGYYRPERPWRWALAIFLGQFLGMCLRNGEIGNMWPLGLALMAVLSLPAIVAALLASRLRRRPGGGAS